MKEGTAVRTDRLKILLVDDEDIIVRELKRMIHMVAPHADLVGASSVDEARRFALQAAARGASFDIIIADVDLLEATGFDLAQRLSREVGDLPRFIFMSGSINEQKIDAARRFGADVFDKIDLSSLVDAMVDEIIRRRTGSVRIVRSVDDIIYRTCRLCRAPRIVVRYDGTLAPHRLPPMGLTPERHFCEGSMKSEEET